MNLRQALDNQIQTTRLLNEDDLQPDDPIYPAVWNGVIFRPSGNFYSSGKPMQLGEKLLMAYEVSIENTPQPLLIEESEIDDYDGRYDVIRVTESIPVLQRIQNPSFAHITS